MKFKKTVISVIIAAMLSIPFLLITPVAFSDQQAEDVTVTLRIEGSAENFFSGAVTINKIGETDPKAIEFLEKVLIEEGMSYEILDLGWGKYVASINGESGGKFGGWDGWLFMVNGVSASVGAADYQVNDGDDLVFFYGNFPPATLIPQVDITPSPIYIDQEIILQLTSKYYDWVLEEEVTVVVSDANVTLVGIEGADYITDENGQAVIPGVDKHGSYILSISKDITGDCPAIVRTSDSITITVNHPFMHLYEETSLFYHNTKNLPSWTEALIFNVDGLEIMDGTWGLPQWSDDDLEEGSEAIRYPGVIIGLIATGKNPANIWTGRNLVQELVNLQEESGAFPGGLNSTVWAMIALDISLADYNRSMALNHILDSQKEDGGYVFFGENSDPDSTAMALILLSGYMEENGVTEAINNALDYLESCQEETAAFSSWGSENANSTACVLSALISVGEDINSERWMKGELTILDALLEFQLENGSFSYLKNPLESNSFATKDALMALSDLIAGDTIYYRHGFNYSKGDITGNGKVEVEDAIAVLRQIVGLKDLDYYSYMAADVDNDGKVNVSDAIVILRYIVGITLEL